MSQKTHIYTGDSKIPVTPIRFLFFVAKPHLWLGASAFLTVTLAQCLVNASPYIFKLIIDGVTSTSDKAEQLHAIMFWGGVYVGVLAVTLGCWRVSGFLGSPWLGRVGVTAYKTLYSYVTLHSHSYFSDRFAGAISHKINHAAEGGVRMLEQTLWGYYERVLGFILSSALMFYVDVRIGLIFSALILVLIVLNIPLAKMRKPYVVDFAKAASMFRGRGVDMLTNITAVRQYAARDTELVRLEESAREVAKKDVKQDYLAESILSLNSAFIVVALAAIMYFMLHLFSQDAITSGDIVLVLTLIFASAGNLIFIGQAMSQAIRLYGEVEEGLEDVLLPHEITDTSRTQNLVVQNAEIAWKNVCFEFGENKVFKNFELTIAPGQRVGLVGPSGAGKTTFVSLLLRQHDLTSGAIEIDGQNIAEVTQDSLRSNIAVVPQEPALFHRSIRENIAYGKPDATDEEVMEVAKKAQAHDFIASLPEGYDTLVGERGVKLSGGQRQRVAIARAMLKNAPILILDEATSALDSESEVAIQKALHELMEGKTVVAIAHRLSTLREMDRILVLENGQIVEDGTHTELTKNKGTYAKLWEHQAGGFLQE